MLDKVRNFLNENKKVQSLRRFYAGDLYLAVTALAAAIAYCCSIELFVAPLLILFCGAGLIISKDFKPYLIILLIFVYMVPPTHMQPDSGAFTNSYYYKNLGALICYAALIVLTLAARFTIHGGFTKIFKTKTKLTFFVIPLAAAFLFNGFLAENYRVGNLIFGFTMAFCMCFLYLVIVHNIDYDDKTVTYFCKVCFYIALTLIVEIIYVYVKGAFIYDGTINKDLMQFGWGICNNYGAMVAVLIPPILYLVTNEKRWYIYYGVAMLTFVATIFSFSRAAMLVGTAAFIFGLVVIMLLGNNAKKCIIANCAMLIIGVTVVIVRRDALMTIFKSILDMKFSDRGRFNLWKLARDNFIAHPVFGGGFYSCEFVSRGFLPSFYHNTVIEIGAVMGAFGLTAYLAFRAKTLYLCFRKLNAERLFLGLMLAVLLGTSLLDNHMFNIYPLFYHAVMIALIELDFNKTAVPLLGKKAATTVEPAEAQSAPATETNE